MVTRGCPHHCDFCYKDAFFQGGKSFYTQQVDDALAEIDRLPGRHLYFLDDHLLGHKRFARDLFRGMQGMGRIFQGAATVDSILDGNLIEEAAEAKVQAALDSNETPIDPQRMCREVRDWIDTLGDPVIIGEPGSPASTQAFWIPGWQGSCFKRKSQFA